MYSIPENPHKNHHVSIVYSEKDKCWVARCEECDLTKRVH